VIGANGLTGGSGWVAFNNGKRVVKNVTSAMRLQLLLKSSEVAIDVR